jgi:hypothetical protein
VNVQSLRNLLVTVVAPDRCLGRTLAVLYNLVPIFSSGKAARPRLITPCSTEMKCAWTYAGIPIRVLVMCYQMKHRYKFAFAQE